MKQCPYQTVGEIDREVVWTAIAQLSETAIKEMAARSPEMFYKWLLETYTAKRKAELELEFQSALLEKLQRCDAQGQLQSLAAA